MAAITTQGPTSPQPPAHSTPPQSAANFQKALNSKSTPSPAHHPSGGSAKSQGPGTSTELGNSQSRTKASGASNTGRSTPVLPNPTQIKRDGVPSPLQNSSDPFYGIANLPHDLPAIKPQAGGPAQPRIAALSQPEPVPPLDALDDSDTLPASSEDQIKFQRELVSDDSTQRAGRSYSGTRSVDDQKLVDDKVKAETLARVEEQAEKLNAEPNKLGREVAGILRNRLSAFQNPAAAHELINNTGLKPASPTAALTSLMASETAALRHALRGPKLGTALYTGVTTLTNPDSTPAEKTAAAGLITQDLGLTTWGAVNDLDKHLKKIDSLRPEAEAEKTKLKEPKPEPTRNVPPSLSQEQPYVVNAEPDYTGARPVTPEPDYPGARPVTPEPDYPGARPVTPEPDYPGARPVTPNENPKKVRFNPEVDFKIRTPDVPDVPDVPPVRERIAGGAASVGFVGAGVTSGAGIYNITTGDGPVNPQDVVDVT